MATEVERKAMVMESLMERQCAFFLEPKNHMPVEGRRFWFIPVLQCVFCRGQWVPLTGVELRRPRNRV
jgi:hypothetical protein